MINRRTALLAAGAVLLAGCTAPPAAAPPAASTPPPEPATPGPAFEPAEVEVPAIGAAGPLIPLGLDDRGGWAEPDVQQPGVASWYTGSVRPGEPGPAVILGHVNGGGRPGVFARLAETAAGDEVLVHGADGSTRRFTVSSVEQLPKTAFRSAAVLTDTGRAELTLITCGDDFDETTGHYTGSVIVRTTLA